MTNKKDEQAAAASPDLASVFSCGMLRMEFYMEMIHSLDSIGVVDMSPGQGQYFNRGLLT